MTTIYALRDPRTDAIRYVGKTTRPLGARVSRHLAKARMGVHEGEVCGWLREIMNDGLAPRAEVLEQVPARLANAAEIIWIAQLRQLGASLTNVARGGVGTVGVLRSAGAREQIGARSRAAWRRSRAKIIAAQNAGKGDAWREILSANAKAQCADGSQVRKMNEGRNTPVARRNMMLASAKKLTETDVIDIRAALACGESQQAIAKRFGVNPSQISRINCGKRWKYGRTDSTT